MEIVKYWNERNTPRGYQKSSSYNEQRHQYLATLIENKGKRLLKVDMWNEGGNKGCFDLQLFYGNYVVGMDISIVACKKAKTQNDWLEVLNADLRFLPFRRESFDVIFDISTSDHLQWEGFCESIRCYSQLLSDHGELLLIYNNKIQGGNGQSGPYSFWFESKDVRRIVSEYFTVKVMKPFGTHPNELKHWLVKADKR